jgi:hypothetical protein
VRHNLDDLYLPEDFSRQSGQWQLRDALFAYPSAGGAALH